jgi:hypothetical protein
MVQIIALVCCLNVTINDSSYIRNSKTLPDGTQINYLLSKKHQFFTVLPPQLNRRLFHEDERFLELRIENDYRKKEFLNTIKPIAWPHTRDSLVMNTTPSFGYNWFKDGSSSGYMNFYIMYAKTEFFYEHPEEVIAFILLLREQVEKYILKAIRPNTESVAFHCSSLKMKDLIQQ